MAIVKGDRVTFSIVYDDGPGTPARRVEHNGTMLTITEPRKIDGIADPVSVAGIRADNGEHYMVNAKDVRLED